MPDKQLNGPCSNCPAKCCRNYSVSLTDIDLKELAKVANLDDSVELELAEGFDPKLAPSFVLNLDGQEKKYILRLRRDRKETCVFLGKNNFCTIYENRPRKCRTYPFVKTKLDDLELKDGARCPVKWKMTVKMDNSFRQDIEEQTKEIEKFRKICEKWNRDKGEKTIERFFDFVIS
ncbi:MAG: YkgJ family cysteine cluster protein [Candidatus Bilamarchaeum sp.]|jgi:Fe-S-cluster containining protein